MRGNLLVSFLNSVNSMEKTEWIIDVNNLSKTFKNKPAVTDVSLKIKSGEIFGFVGPNGAGKTTTMRMLCGLIQPDSGNGKCFGYDILNNSRAIKNYLGYMPQRFSLYEDLSVYKNLDFIARVYGLVNREQQINEYMAKFNLTNRRDQLAGSLSGGWKQKLALAAALLHDPLILFLDEPTAGVDAKSRREFLSILQSLSARGITILLTTHNLDEIECCHRIAYINRGKIFVQGSINEIIDNIGLTTWEVTGANLPLLANQLRVMPGIEQVTIFFNTLHVSSKNADELSRITAPFRTSKHFHWQLVKPLLEDVFIWLSDQDKGNNNV